MGTKQGDFAQRSAYFINKEHFAELCADLESVAAVIYKAATDGKNKLRYIAGKDVSMFTKVRWLLPLNIFMKIVKSKFDK